MSLLLATSILALGGVGLYMYKSSDHEYNGSDDSSYDEDNLFGGSRSFWGSNEDDEDDNEYKNFQEEAEPQPEPEPKVRARSGKTKTKRNSRNVGSKRRY